MTNKEKLKCDFEDCQNTAKWYRVVKRTPMKVCEKHEEFMCDEKLGNCVRLHKLRKYEMDVLEDNSGEFDFRCPNCGIKRLVSCSEILEENSQVRCPKCKIIMFKI